MYSFYCTFVQLLCPDSIHCFQWCKVFNYFDIHLGTVGSTGSQELMLPYSRPMQISIDTNNSHFSHEKR